MALPHTQGLTEAPDGLDTATVDAAILGDREGIPSHWSTTTDLHFTAMRVECSQMKATFSR